MEKFPGREKNYQSDTYQYQWLGYESAFETILAAWDEVVRGSGRWHNLVLCVDCGRDTLLRRRASSPSCGPVRRSRVQGSVPASSESARLQCH